MTLAGHEVKLDGTITLGHILQAVVLLGSMFTAYVMLRASDVEQQTRITNIETRLDRDSMVQTQILTTLGTIREDIATLKERSQRTATD